MTLDLGPPPYSVMAKALLLGIYLLDNGVYLSYFDQFLPAFNRCISVTQVKLLSKRFIAVLVDTVQSPYKK